MECPRCQVELVEYRCEKCGYELPAKDQETPEGGPAAVKNPIAFSATASKGKSVPKDANWRSELKRKLEHHRQRGVEPPSRRQAAALGDAKTKAQPKTPPRAAPKIPAPSPVPPKASAGEKEIVRQLFRYRLGDPAIKKDRGIVTFQKKEVSDAKSPAGAPSKPLIRKPAKSRRPARREDDPNDLLPLKRIAGAHESGLAAAGSLTRIPADPAIEPVSSEILLSRFLAGIVDLAIAGGGGVLCALIASQILGAPFSSPDLLLLVLFCGVMFFFLNSTFFLLTLGRTPGMMWTDLRLVEEEQDQLTLGPVLLRTLLFLPLAATLVGLIWALFDEQRRCWHDQLSGTRVIADKRK